MIATEQKTPQYILIGTYLAVRESNSAEFQLKCIRAKALNKISCAEHIKIKDEFDMTPQEELFSQFFNHEQLQVKDMSLLELRAHREQLAKIAFEARARLAADDDSIKDKEKTAKGATGFRTSLTIDDASTNAINNIKTRQARMTKEEKVLKNLTDLQMLAGHSHDEAVKIARELMSAGSILAQIKSANPSVNIAAEVTKIRNPFLKHPNPIDEIPEPKKPEVSIQEDSNTIIITKADVLEISAEDLLGTEKPKFKSPFLK